MPGQFQLLCLLLASVGLSQQGEFSLRCFPIVILLKPIVITSIVATQWSGKYGTEALPNDECYTRDD
jgi:hypothetical protein